MGLLLLLPPPPLLPPLQQQLLLLQGMAPTPHQLAMQATYPPTSPLTCTLKRSTTTT
jgi:hypothetical protein